MPGYHLMQFPRGEYGELSKIQEELNEITDSVCQDCKIMALVELSDLYGAIEGYLEKHHPDITMEDLRKMSAITKRAFRSGARR
jgi:hypothetical protein